MSIQRIPAVARGRKLCRRIEKKKRVLVEKFNLGFLVKGGTTYERSRCTGV